MICNRLQVLGYSICVLFLLLFPVTCTLSTISAAESTPSADIKAKLEELKKEIASKAAKLKQEVNRKLQNRAYIGKVKTKTPQTLTLATDKGPKIVNINQDTIFESKVKGSLREARKKFSQKLLAEEDFLAALGDVDETAVLTAKKLILLPRVNVEPKTSIWGQIVAISDKLITIKGKDLKNIAATLSNLSAIKVNDFVLLTGKLGKNEIFNGEFVYVIPQGGILKTKISTPSAKVATSSASPKPTKTP